MTKPAAVPHSTVVSQPVAVPRSAAGAQPASTPQRASTSLPTVIKSATVENPAGPETLQSNRRRKSLAKACPKNRAASEPEASASEKESLPATRSAAVRPSKGPRLAEFKYAGFHSSDSPRHLESRLLQLLRVLPSQQLRAFRKNKPRRRRCCRFLAPDSRTLRASRRH